MIIQFKDRKRELRAIEDIVDSKGSKMFIIYGRRRVGKTELILHATKSKKRVYYLATGENNLERFYNSCMDFSSSVGNLKMDWEVLFNFLKDKADVIIIDEFQNMIAEDKNILNIFQSIVDVVLKGSDLKLFLLGSSVSIMTSKVLSYKSPLYGRRAGSMNLKPVSFFDLGEFFPKASIEELVEIYGFADGIPFYLVKIEGEFWQWLKNELKEERGFLRDEADFLVRYEFVEVGTYKLILEAIANGKSKLNEIKDYIKVKRTDITPYLRNLIDIGFVKREVPITENIKSRMGRYFISDNFLNFWFRYIYPNISSIEQGIFDTKIIRDSYSSYLGRIFENISKQFIILKKPINFTKIGSWWHKDKEIDIVALNEETKDIMFVECKWTEKKVDVGIIVDLMEKAKFVDWNNTKRKEHFAIISKGGYTERAQKLAKEHGFMLFGLKDF